MLKKVLSLLLIALLFNVSGVTTARAGAQLVEITRNAEKVKENVRKLGTGDAARVELKLWDGRRLKGSVREAGEDRFVVADAKTGAPATVTYAEVKQVKGRNHFNAAKVGLSIMKGAAIVSAIAIGFTLLALVSVPKT